LVKAEEARRFGRRQWLAVDLDPLFRQHQGRGTIEQAPVERDAAGRDQGLGIAPRAEAGAGDDLCDSLAGRGGKPVAVRSWQGRVQIRFSSKSAQECPKATSPSSRKSARRGMPSR